MSAAEVESSNPTLKGLSFVNRGNGCVGIAGVDHQEAFVRRGS